MEKGVLAHLATLLPLVTAGLYIFGFSYHQAYLGLLGIEPSLLQMSFHQIIFHGFVATMRAGAITVLMAALGAEVIFFGSEIAIDIATAEWSKSILGKATTWARNFFSKEDRVNRPAPKKEAPEALKSFRRLSRNMFAITVAIAVAFLMLLLSSMLAEKTGREAAQNFIDRVHFDEGMVAVTIKEAEEPVVGYEVGCGETHCAYWTKNGGVAVSRADIRESKLYKSNK